MNTTASNSTPSMRSALRAAQTLEALDALYVDWIGYSAVEDDPGLDADNLRADLTEFLDEIDFDDARSAQ